MFLNPLLQLMRLKKNIKLLDDFLKIKKGNKAYYEAQLKYCNFYLFYSEEKSDKNKVKKIFENLIQSDYYEAAIDYGRFLMKEEKYDEAKNVLKKGMDNSQQFCLSEYVYIFMREFNINEILSDYKICSYILNNLLLIIAFEKLSMSSFFYMYYYMIKHSSFKEQIEKEYIKYIIEIYNKQESDAQMINNEAIQNKFYEKYLIDIPSTFANSLYYGIFKQVKANKEKALVYFKKAYKLAKEKNYRYFKRINYLYIYKCRKYLFKNNKITLRKLNKTKEKLFRIYESTNTDDLNSIELYNYYKLYKIGVIGNTQKKLITILKQGKNEKIFYHFKNMVYKEKCKIDYEREYSYASPCGQNNIILKNENEDNINKINVCFKTMETNNQYKILVSKDLQFIKVVHKLFTNYPELESKHMGAYVCNQKKSNYLTLY